MKNQRIYKVLEYIGAFCILDLLANAAYAAPANMPTEITTIKNGTEGFISGLCWFIGTCSAVWGTFSFVKNQSLQSALLSGTVTIMAFKFPAWVIAAAVI